MTKLDQYLEAAVRDNTRQSYASAIRHFEIDWGGFLPATADSIARYLAHHAETHSVNTLQQRLAALAQWHIEQGFPDPTKAPVVRKTFRGIRALHLSQEKQAKPLLFDQIEQVAQRLNNAVLDARRRCNRGDELRHLRDRSFLLLGFWRGFRGDELTRLLVEHVEVVPGQGMICYFPISKGDRQNEGSTFRAPALSRLCPVDAFVTWITAAQLTQGPAYRGIDRWGHVSDRGLHSDSVIPLLRAMLGEAAIPDADCYSAHSLRRGFASWATSNGWDLKTLMEYVGWKNVQSAIRYIDAGDPFARHRIESQIQSTLVDDAARPRKLR
ncbi:site-specific integrase [Massilia horti]|uniref:Site-specific integrase n=1 Tax=Massilia horti TaxID=2562153 RepID=A0A4Y9T3W9_9BURK|nr:site-specific integrase [Massilia horti]TFW31753.1 site-specific integrase [Massilia horti]